MKMHKPVVGVVLALVVSLIGCSKGPDSVVLAKVNRGAITAADFKKQLIHTIRGSGYSLKE